jgi:hypothetical protein
MRGKGKRRKNRIKVIREPTDEDEYLSRVDARMTRLALRLDRRRKRGYIV